MFIDTSFLLIWILNNVIPRPNALLRQRRITRIYQKHWIQSCLWIIEEDAKKPPKKVKIYQWDPVMSPEAILTFSQAISYNDIFDIRWEAIGTSAWLMDYTPFNCWWGSLSIYLSKLSMTSWTQNSKFKTAVDIPALPILEDSRLPSLNYPRSQSLFASCMWMFSWLIHQTPHPPSGSPSSLFE